MHQRNLTKQCVVYSLMCIFPSFVSTPFALSFFKNAVNLLTEILLLLNLIIFSPVCYPVTTLMTNNQGGDDHGVVGHDDHGVVGLDDHGVVGAVGQDGHELTILLLDKMNSWKNVSNVQFDQSTRPQKTSMGSQITTAPSVSG